MPQACSPSVSPSDPHPRRRSLCWPADREPKPHTPFEAESQHCRGQVVQLAQPQCSHRQGLLRQQRWQRSVRAALLGPVPFFFYGTTLTTPCGRAPLQTENKPQVNERVLETVARKRTVIYSCGSFYTSILPCLIVKCPFPHRSQRPIQADPNPRGRLYLRVGMQPWATPSRPSSRRPRSCC